VDKPAGKGNAGVTASDVRVVDGDERVGELARMLAGSDSPTAREHAAELLRDAAHDEHVEARRRLAQNARKGARRAG
jgi:DNA repair protein RecN (Recombination protein N)